MKKVLAKFWSTIKKGLAKVTPRYFRDSYHELKKVTWPSRKESWRLFLAVVLFAIVLGGVIAIADIFFEQVIERLVL